MSFLSRGRLVEEAVIVAGGRIELKVALLDARPASRQIARFHLFPRLFPVLIITVVSELVSSYRLWNNAASLQYAVGCQTYFKKSTRDISYSNVSSSIRATSRDNTHMKDEIYLAYYYNHVT
jgi:hypothetical protein